VTALSRPTALPPKAHQERLPAQIWLASCVTFLAASADNVVLLLLVWLAAPQGWTGVQTAMVVVALRMPALVTGFFVGGAVDSWGPRRVVIADLATRAVLLVCLTVVGLARGQLPLPAVLVVGSVCGATSPATYAAVRWMIPRLVSTRRFGRANAVVGLSDQLPLLVGGALVGPSLALLGPAVSMAVPAAMLLTALALVSRLPDSASPATPDVAGTSAPARSGRRFPAGVLALITLSTAYYFLYGPFETATPSFVREQLHADQATYSMLWALFGLGATLGLPLGALLARHRRPGVVNALGAATWGLLMLPLVVLHDDAWVALLFLVSGIVWGPYTTIETSALQRWTDPSRHGALFGLQRGLLGTATPLGAAAGAIAVQGVAAHIVLAASAAACAGAGLLALLSRDLRQAR
jgi:predicted MFS family arabinose efflux permease